MNELTVNGINSLQEVIYEYIKGAKDRKFINFLVAANCKLESAKLLKNESKSIDILFDVAEEFEEKLKKVRK